MGLPYRHQIHIISLRFGAESPILNIGNEVLSALIYNVSYNKCNVLSLMSWLCCVVFRITLILMLRVSVLCSGGVRLCVVNTISGQCAILSTCVVIVTYYVLISVLLVSYVVSIQCRLISLRFTSIVKVFCSKNSLWGRFSAWVCFSSFSTPQTP